MLKSYLKIAVRKLLKNKSYTTINILGLSVGIASCIVIFLIVQFELSFNTANSKGERVYRLVTISHSSEGASYTQGVPFPITDGLRAEYPNAGKVAAVYSADDALIDIPGNNTVSDKKFKEESGVYYAEPEYFEIFDVKWLIGSPKTALSAPGEMVLSRSTADKYFGDWKTAIGKIIKYNNNDIYKVTGIISDIPANNDYQLKAVFSYETYKKQNPDNFKDWVSTYSNNNCFVLLNKSVSASQLDKFIAGLKGRHVPKEYSKDVVKCQALKDVHYDSRFNANAFSRELITALSLIGVFLLLIACVNFINLATAQAVNRSREIGVRKVLGSKKHQIVMQFLGETASITFFALLFALVITEVALPFVNNLLKIKLELSFIDNPVIIIFLIAIYLLVIFLSGFYPALILSGVNPINAFRQKLTGRRRGGLSLRRGLVIFQFVIAQVIVIGMIVVVNQMSFFRNSSYGFDRNEIVIAPIPPDTLSLKKLDALKNRLVQQPGILNVSFSCFSPSDNSHWSSDFKFNGSPEHSNFEADLKWADADYFKTYGIKFLAGRPYTLTDSIDGLVVNEAFVNKFGYKNPWDILGKNISFFHNTISAPIVGVVNDFHNRPLGGKINPIVMGSWKSVYQLINIKISPANTQNTLVSIERLWSESFPDYLYEYKFLDQKIDEFYKKEDRLSQLYKVFAAIAIFISCLGLYGLVSFMAVQRTKEVGIRKVLGASTMHIIMLYSKEFTILIGIAFLIASPLAYYFMHRWLESFAYRIGLGAGIFIISFIISITVAWLTVGYRAIKSAAANPVKSLKYE